MNIKQQLIEFSNKSPMMKVVLYEIFGTYKLHLLPDVRFMEVFKLFQQYQEDMAILENDKYFGRASQCWRILLDNQDCFTVWLEEHLNANKKSLDSYLGGGSASTQVVLLALGARKYVNDTLWCDLLHPCVLGLARQFLQESGNAA